MRGEDSVGEGVGCGSVSCYERARLFEACPGREDLDGGEAVFRCVAHLGGEADGRAGGANRVARVVGDEVPEEGEFLQCLSSQKEGAVPS